MKKLLLVFFAFILFTSCDKEIKITKSKDIIKRESENIVVNINISNFTANQSKIKAELTDFNTLRNVELNKYADTLENEANNTIKELADSPYGKPS